LLICSGAGTAVGYHAYFSDNLDTLLPCVRRCGAASVGHVMDINFDLSQLCILLITNPVQC
jgi:hypothetical protein